MTPRGSPRPGASGRPTGRARGPTRGWLREHLFHRHDPLTSLVLTLPVFALYHLGLPLLDGVRNGVDLFSGALFALARASLAGYLALTAALCVGIALAGLWLRRRQARLDLRAFAPVVAEGAAWAVVLWLLGGWATAELLGAVLASGQAAPEAFGVAAGPIADQAVARLYAPVAAQLGGRGVGPLDALVISAGAGFHEELVFRAGLFAGLAFALERGTRLGRPLALALAALASALVFSAAHHVGPSGDPLAAGPFVFRTMLGLLLAGIYALRGFAVAVYAHFLYDVLYFWLLRFL
jgi:membrane protease YdiL (CAAX protease family)